jgi:hypothetical protein
LAFQVALFRTGRGTCVKNFIMMIHLLFGLMTRPEVPFDIVFGQVNNINGQQLACGGKGVIVREQMLFKLRTQLSQTNNQPAGKPWLITCY